MSLRNTTIGYGSIAKIFHWLLFILIIGMLIAGFLLGSLPKDLQPIAYNIHKLTGLLILTLMILRLLWALINPHPALPLGAPWYEDLAERCVHSLIYLAIIIMPLSGWIGSVAAGRPPKLGNYSFNLPVEQNKELVESAFGLHETLAFIIIALVTVHVVAALYHHFIRKDDILKRMLPGK